MSQFTPNADDTVALDGRPVMPSHRKPMLEFPTVVEPDVEASTMVSACTVYIIRNGVPYVNVMVPVRVVGGGGPLVLHALFT
jgi:hypothetical protein